MSKSAVPQDLKYTQSHEWIKKDNAGNYIVGISDHAQSLLGDLVYVDLPKEGAFFDKGQDLGVVESVKAASDVYAPISGTVVAVNSELQTQPELVNKDPYEQGWICAIKPAQENECAELLSAEEYRKAIHEE